MDGRHVFIREDADAAKRRPSDSQRPFIYSRNKSKAFKKKIVTNVHDARRSPMMALDVGSVLAPASSSARIQPDAAYLE
jgi:hypothetical protein